MQAITKTAPAFQFYASDTMADKRYRSMSLQERGLFISLLCECWVNRSIPADPQIIGKWLGFPNEVIEAALTENVSSFFSQANGEFINPELERYRTKLEEGREQMSRGGKKGAERRWKKPSENGYRINPADGVWMGSRVEESRNEKNRGEKSSLEEKQHYPNDKEDTSDDNHNKWKASYEV